MTEKQLQELGLSEEQIPVVLALKGKSIATVETEKNALKAQTESLNAQLAEANKAIESFKGLDIDGIKKAADDWKNAAEQAKKDADARVAAVEYDAALKEKISGIKFSSELAKKAAIEELRAKGLKFDKGEILGLDDAIKTMQEADKSAFVIDDPDPAPPQLPSGTRLFQPDGGGKKTPADVWVAKLAEARKTNNLQAAVTIKQQAASEGIILN